MANGKFWESVEMHNTKIYPPIPNSRFRFPSSITTSNSVFTNYPNNYAPVLCNFSLILTNGDVMFKNKVAMKEV